MKALLSLLVACAALSAQTWKAGVASVAITPTESVWMSGYGNRDEPSHGVAQELHGKALAIEDPAGNRAVLLTTDLIGVSRELTAAVAGRLEASRGLERSRVLLTASHTHGGPAITRNLPLMQPPTPELQKRTADYTAWLENRLVALAEQAVDDLAPARLSYHLGSAGFAANRREWTPEGSVKLGYNPDGPVDHDVPVLAVRAPDGKLRAALFSYASHNTTLGGDQMEMHADYAGFAQEVFEADHGGATALFMSGCAGDSNPRPRGEMEHARQHGRELAAAVGKALSGEGREVKGRLATSYETFEIPLQTPPDLAEWQRRAREAESFEKELAIRVAARIEAEGPLGTTYDYPLQVIRFGDAATLVALGGEVVSEYGLTLKRELGADRTWVVAYSNDVMGYIPTAKMLEEGGYEPVRSQVYYGMPGPWAPEIEPMILDRAREAVRRIRR